jgi:hypothetical protein
MCINFIRALINTVTLQRPLWLSAGLTLAVSQKRRARAAYVGAQLLFIATTVDLWCSELNAKHGMHCAWELGTTKQASF